MGKFRVNYKLLREQSAVIKETNKAFKDCTERMKATAEQLNPKEDPRVQVLIRNLNDGVAVLEQMAALVQMAGQLLEGGVDRYNKCEANAVKRVDSCRAHNRDFYKNPVVVASAGGAAVSGAGGAAVAGAGGVAVADDVNMVNVNSNSATSVKMNSTIISNTNSPVRVVSAKEPVSGAAVATGIGAGAAVLGGVAAVGAVAGGVKANKEKTAEEERKTAADNELTALEAELDAAIAKAKAFEPTE